jgi:exo-1,4-beta-D-glucosaminidase
MELKSYFMLGIALWSGCLGHLRADTPTGRATINLRDGWRIQSSTSVKENGEVVSTPRYKPEDWYPATVPATVLTALVADRVYADPYFGTNLRDIPGTRYRVGGSFANIMMPPESPFRSSWWYRTEFQDPGKLPGRRVWLQFDGINFRANVWLNGSRIADSTQVAGTYRMYEFDITDAVSTDSTNVLAVEVFPPRPSDLAISWVGINPDPADKDMGLWRSVRIVTTGPIAIRHPQVISHLDLPNKKVAHLTITADLQNATDHPIKGILKAHIESIDISQNIELGPREGRSISFSPTRFSPLNVSSPRLWWPWQMGPQDLYELALEFVSAGQVSDAEKVQFGIREVTSELDAANHRVFSVNGQKILLRGAGWWSDMMLRSSPERQEWEIRYARDLNLNALRMDGMFEDDHFAELADQYGLLLLPGWCCCTHWEHWKEWDEEDYTVAPASLRDRLRSFRNHPSVLVWLMGDDNPPPPRVEAMYKDIIKASNWPNSVIASATAKPTALSGNSGVKMNGPYEWVPPTYWFTDREGGGAFGLATEVGPGIVIPPLESLRKFLPASHLWPPDEVWSLHAGDSGSPDVNREIFTQALEERYGRANSLQDYTKKAQLMSYEAQRAMFEAYSRNKYVSTGLLQQFLNSAWPSMEWHIYDYYLRPAGAYFGTKKACEPLHIQYSYDNRSIVAVNSTYRSFTKLKAKATVYDLNLRERFSKEAIFDAAPDSTNSLFPIPEIESLSTTYFLDLRMADSSGVQISSNFYWLSTKPDVLDPSRRPGDAPMKAFADYTALQGLAPAQVRVSGRIDKDGNEDLAHITVENPSKQLTFFLRVRLANEKDEEEILPILLQDSYFSLLPGERKEVTAKFERSPGLKPVVEVEGWNVPRQSVPLSH